MPPTTASASAMLPSSSETGNVSTMISVTVRVLYTNEVPKSPWRAFCRKTPNWT